MPHRQLDQFSPAEIHSRLLDQCLALPGVRPRQSRMAPAGTLALSIADDAALGGHDAYIDQHEFCHLHAPPDGSIHLVLPVPFQRQVIDLGWAEPHPLAGTALSPCLVMIYSPRDVEELEIVLSLIEIGRFFATGAVSRRPTTAAD